MKKNALLLLTAVFFASSILCPSKVFSDFTEVATPESITTQAIKTADPISPYSISGEGLVDLINNMVDFEIAGSSIIFNRFTGQLVIKNTPSNLSQIEEVLTELRKSSFKQVEIEARIITVTSDDINSLGLGALDLNTYTRFDGGDGLFTTGTSGFGVNEIDFPNIYERNSTDPFGQRYGTVLENKNFELGTFIQALKSRAEVNTLSSPRLTVFNNQRAHIKIATYTTFVSEVDGDIETSGDQIYFTVDTTTRTAPEGTILDVTPMINNDGTITLTLHPSFVRADLTDTESLSTISQSSDSTPSSLAANTIILPEFTTQTLDTTVVIPDGGMTVLGGLIDEIETKTDHSIPYLSAIPWIGRFFTDSQNRDEKTHMLIFLKATSKYVDTDGKVKR